MKKNAIKIDGIPALLWGGEAGRLFIAVHGNMSSKDDEAVAIFAEEAAAAGCRTLSFDLPGHGERKGEPRACSVQNCVADLGVVGAFARGLSPDLGLFGCSMGAYFSLLALRGLPLARCLFLSPVLDMGRLIDGMMKAAGVSEARLEAEKEIHTPYGPLYWDYYSYVKAHPVTAWDKPTEILCASADAVSEPAAVAAFAARFGCGLKVLPGGEHYFHTPEQLSAYRRWLREKIGDAAQ